MAIGWQVFRSLADRRSPVVLLAGGYLVHPFGGRNSRFAARILLQRSVPLQLVGRVFGVLEGLMMAGYALGALLVPLLVHLGGDRLALLGVAAVLPLAAVIGGRAVFRLDAETPVPVVETALLRSLPLFAELPTTAIEGLTAVLGHAPTRQQADRIADARLASGAAPGIPEAGPAE